MHTSIIIQHTIVYKIKWFDVMFKKRTRLEIMMGEEINDEQFSAVTKIVTSSGCS